MGEPKALLRHPDGRSWLATALEALVVGGCAPLAVVLGAAADRARPLLAAGRDLTVLENPDWREGLGSSLRLGLEWCLGLDASVGAVLVMLVDTPGVGPHVVRHLLRHADGAEVLARATYRDAREPSHPVLLGRAHWAAIHATSVGDQGARRYLATHAPQLVDCSDFGSGGDVDEPPGMLSPRAPPPARRRP